MNPVKTFSRRILLSCAFGCLVVLTSCFHQQQPPPEEHPVAQFSYTPATPKPGEEVIFDGSASSAPAGATIVSYRWDFGDGANADGMIVTHTYSQVGSYTVRLTVTDDQNRQATAEQTITVVAAPSAQESLPLPQAITDLQGLAWDGENFWALDSANLTLYKLSGSHGQALETFTLSDTEYPTAVAWDGESRRLFVLDGNANTIYQVNADDGTIVRKVELAEGVPLGMAWGDGSLWVSDFDAAKIYKISPDTGQVLQTVLVGVPGAALLSLSWGQGALWVYDSNGDMIYKIDPASGQKLGELVPPGPGTVGLAWDRQSLWVADGSELKLYKVQP